MPTTPRRAAGQKLYSLARDAQLLLGPKKAGVEFLAANMPYANRLIIGVMALVAEDEARATPRCGRFSHLPRHLLPQFVLL